MKIHQSKSELETHLIEQLEFLQRSAKHYDLGAESEAKRMAATIRVLLHDTSSSHSLLDQLKMKKIGFLDSSVPYDEKSNEYHFGLISVELSFDGKMHLVGKNLPLLDNPKKTFKTKKKFFADWWNQTVIVDSHKNKFSRRMLILSIANTDGGAHVDPKLDAEYKALSRENSMGLSVGTNGSDTPILGVELASVRQIAYEIIVSIKDRYPQFVRKNI